MVDLASLLGRLWWLPFGRVPEVEPVDLQARLADGAGPLVLDVRTRGEWRRGHVPGSVNVPIQELRGRLGSLALDPRRAVVAICLSAHRSVPAVRLLRSRGFAEVAQLRGGMLAWWGAKLPTETGSPARGTSREAETDRAAR